MGLAAVTIVVTLSIASIVLTTIFDRHLERRLEQELSGRLLELAASFAVEEGTPVLTRPLADPRYDQPLSGAYWQVSDATGALLRSRSLWDATLRPDDPRGLTPRAYAAAGPGDSTLTILERTVRLGTTGTPKTYRLAVAVDHAELVELGTSFRVDVVMALGAIAVVLVLGAWLQLGLGLAPLARLQAAVARIRDGRATRLEGPFPAEIAPLAGSLNDLINAQEASVQKARERAGDLAHGLKTPLAILTGEARKLDEAGQAAAAVQVREQIAQMRAHVERQLARARSHGASAAGGTLTDASDMVERLLGLMRRIPRGEGLDWRSTLPPGVRLRMDPEDFGEVMGNLLDNARIWARSAITISAELAGPVIRIAIDDNGPGIPAHERETLRERGASNAAPGEGSGLGLAIVADVLGLYDTQLGIEDAPQGGCRVSFAVPGWIEDGG